MRIRGYFRLFFIVDVGNFDIDLMVIIFIMIERWVIL